MMTSWTSIIKMTYWYIDICLDLNYDGTADLAPVYSISYYFTVILFLHINSWYSVRFTTDGVIRFNLENLYTPGEENDIVAIVRDAYKNKRMIRVLGDGHSWSEVAQTEDIMISLSNYTGVVRMPLDTDDSGAVHVTVKAGTPLNEISEFLDGKGLAMINLGSVAGQSIAGAISTGKTVTWVHVYMPLTCFQKFVLGHSSLDF